LFVVPADGSEAPRALTSGDHEDVQPAWSPDGTRIAFVSARHEDWDVTPVTDVYVVEAAGGEPSRVTMLDGECSGPSWSPDGTTIAYYYTPSVFDDPRHTQVAVVDQSTGDRKVLTSSLDRNCRPYPEIRELIWDGDTLLFAIEDPGQRAPVPRRLRRLGAAQPRGGRGVRCHRVRCGRGTHRACRDDSELAFRAPRRGATAHRCWEGLH
ncbi:MAG TPA: hypothetical protein VEM93_05405, partial [Actinomycetota bacterium]|nr:hypothetical protein [Actinomycetota bacterium]